jgi:multiple sugar transport system substrate-binding protein
MGTALLPGAPFAAGSSLVVWKNTRNDQKAIDLIRYLTDKETQINYLPQIDHLPARQEFLNHPPFSVDPILSGFVQMVNAARPFSRSRLNSLLEAKYYESIARIWTSIRSEPDANVKDILHAEMRALNSRFENYLTDPCINS